LIFDFFSKLLNDFNSRFDFGRLHDDREQNRDRDRQVAVLAGGVESMETTRRSRARATAIDGR